MNLPSNHPSRFALNDEVHARPPEALTAPTRVSYLALFSDATEREQARRQVDELAHRFGIAPPPTSANHYSADFGAFRLKWERHTEFSRYKIIVSGAGADPFAEPALSAAPSEWIAALPGRIVAAAHAALLPAEDGPLDYEEFSDRFFNGNPLIGAAIAGGAATALTDFRIHQDGFSRFLIHDRSMTTRQAGRMIQRLLEIDTYRIMALLALPVARELSPILTQCEKELADIMTALTGAVEKDEPALLDRLTRLEAEVGRRAADTDYRFSAAAAYYDLVQRRIAELREERIQGLQPFREFTERRLAPAMNTCLSTAARQASLLERAAQTTQLLSTRVDIARQEQNQAVLESMDQRAKLQLRLQETVEGLSVAAITYYVVGLVGYAAKGLKAAGLSFVDPDVAMGVGVPVAALLTWLGVRRIRQIVTRTAG